MKKEIKIIHKMNRESITVGSYTLSFRNFLFDDIENQAAFFKSENATLILAHESEPHCFTPSSLSKFNKFAVRCQVFSGVTNHTIIYEFLLKEGVLIESYLDEIWGIYYNLPVCENAMTENDLKYDKNDFE